MRNYLHENQINKVFNKLWIGAKKRAAVLTMSACCGAMILTLSACGGKNDGKLLTNNKDGEKAESVESDELTGDSVVVSVGDETATYKELLVYMYILKNRYEDKLGDEVWSYQFDSGKSFKSIAMEQVVSMITEMKVISRKADELGIEISGDEKEDIRHYVSTILGAASADDVKNYMLDEETITKVYVENEIANRVFDACINGVDTNISDEEAKQITVQYIYLQTSGTNQSGVEVTLSPEEVQRRLEEATELRKQAKKSTDFAQFAQANTESAESQITFGQGDMSAEFTAAAFALKTGELSKVITAPEGFYIIYCVNDNEQELTAQKKEQMITQAQEAKFEAQYEEWAKEFQIKISNLIL